MSEVEGSEKREGRSDRELAEALGEAVHRLNAAIRDATAAGLKVELSVLERAFPGGQVMPVAEVRVARLIYGAGLFDAEWLE